jgi:nitroimidazol reductase NimA-like FMN-containing flavoprotein (pyridoxamine 5'-phosphate oxidase superfamily)
MDAAPMTELDPSQCWRLLARAEVGRIAVADDDGPDVFPVTHGVDGRRIVFRTAAGTKLFAAEGHDVAFEVDGTETVDDVEYAWSIVAKGVAVAVRDPADLARIEHLDLHPWWDSDKPHVMAIEAPPVTGRRFAVSRPWARA